MANKIISMSVLRQIIILKEKGFSNRAISRQLGLSRKTTGKYIEFVKQSQLAADELLQLTDVELNVLVDTRTRKPVKDYLQVLYHYFCEVEKQLKRVGVTRLLLWQEYKQLHPQGVSYTRFCFHFRRWRQSQQVTMHFDHKAGDKLFVDFTGKKLSVVDPATGEITQVEVFVAVLGASQYTYVEAVPNQKIESFISALIHVFIFFGGVPLAIVPDNLKAAVTKADRYEPQLNDIFQDFGTHYGTSILPARAYKPRDKALVEGAVRIVYSRIFAPLRDKTFTSLHNLNQAIQDALLTYNQINFKGRATSRYSLFEELDKPALQPLPTRPYELKRYIKAIVYKTSHVWLGEDKHYYSVPYRYMGKKVKIAYTTLSVEVYYNYQRIAVHLREKGHYQYTSEKSHLPSTHQFVSDWNPEKFIRWAGDIGPHAEFLIRQILERKPHPEQGYKTCLGILSLAKKVGKQRLEKACDRAAYFNSYSYRIVKNILEKGLEEQTWKPSEKGSHQLNVFHENIRGKEYYQ